MPSLCILATQAKKTQIVLDLAHSISYSRYMATILKQLAKAIEKSDVTRYRISKDTGINQSVLVRIVKGTGGCSLETLDVLCDYLGLELACRKPKRKRR